jgi:hypothetical protein
MLTKWIEYNKNKLCITALPVILIISSLSPYVLLSLCLCLSLYLPPLSIFFTLSILLTVFLSLYLSFFFSLSLSIYLFHSLSHYLSHTLSLCLSISLYLSHSLFLLVSVCHISHYLSHSLSLSTSPTKFLQFQVLQQSAFAAAAPSWRLHIY